MEANVFRQQNRISIPYNFIKHKPQHSHSSIVSVLRSPSNQNINEETKKSSTNVYKDNLFDLIAINHLSKAVQAATGVKNNKSGYESLVEAATMVKQNFNTIEQQEVVLQSLDRLFPQSLYSFIKKQVPPSKFTREFFAIFTTMFFTWLLGPSEVRESEINGKREKNTAYIKKCRFLEETNCVGMCINLCKIPTQSFIKNSLGMPVNMVPNYDDMSCEMIFGLDPPALTDDPSLKQPCYKQCARHIKVMEQTASFNAEGMDRRSHFRTEHHSVLLPPRSILYVTFDMYTVSGQQQQGWNKNVSPTFCIPNNTH